MLELSLQGVFFSVRLPPIQTDPLREPFRSCKSSTSEVGSFNQFLHASEMVEKLVAISDSGGL